MMIDPPRRTLSVRARIIGAMVLLIAVACAASIVLSAQILNARANAMVDGQLTHAATSFRTLAMSPSGSSHFTADALLTRYLQNTVSSRTETAFSLLNDAPHRRMAGDPRLRLDQDPAFLALLTGHTAPIHGRYKAATTPVKVSPCSHELAEAAQLGARS